MSTVTGLADKKQPNRGRGQIKNPGQIRVGMLIKLCYTSEAVGTDFVQAIGDPIIKFGEDRYTVPTVYLYKGVLYSSEMVLAEWGVEPYESGEFEKAHWLRRPNLFEQVGWFLATARAEYSLK